MTGPYAEQLRTWPPERLAALLRARPDLASPPPRDLDDLARRAASPASVAKAVRDLPTPSRLVLEALMLLDEPPVELLIELSGPPPTPEQVELALGDLRTRLLLPPDTVAVERDVARHLRSPIRLGESLAELLPTFALYTLNAMSQRLGLPEVRTKAGARRSARHGALPEGAGALRAAQDPASPASPLRAGPFRAENPGAAAR